MLEQISPHGDLSRIADNLASHLSGPIRDWLAAHPRIQHAFIPVGAAWLNLIEGWWCLGRLLRRTAGAGVSLANAEEIAYATGIATAQLNRHAQPWIWGRPPPPHRSLRRCVMYRFCGTTQLPSSVILGSRSEKFSLCGPRTLQASIQHAA